MANLTTGSTAMQAKALASAGGTASGSALSLWLHNTNAWANEYMPLISMIGIIVGTCMTVWYYTSLIRIKKKELERNK